jgi:para-nitrobenzyl esterase
MIAALVLGVSVESMSMAAITGPVRIESGLVSGVPVGDAVVVFEGMPYAAPPVGALRWRPPEPPRRWQGVRKAEQFGAVCPQPPVPGSVSGRTIDEDCLNLDVWTAAASSAERRPVMVWLHGAGWAGSDPLFDGAALARKGVVVVTINYRVGALGFLATPELEKESSHGSAGNYGLLDDIAALQWVKKNIAAFGGDPSRVTLFGESFGAGSTGFIALSPLAKGLFQRAIMESHVRHPYDPELFRVATNYQTKADAHAAGEKFVAALGVRSLQQARALPWQKVAETAGGNGLAKTIDGWVIPFNYSDTYARGVQSDVFVIAGSNRDESGAQPATAFDLLTAGRDPTIGGPGPILRLADYIRMAQQKFGPMADEFLKLYPASNDREAFLANGDAIRDNHRMSTWSWAAAWRQKATHPVYLYFFAHAPPGKDHDLMGAYHGSEINYVFGHLHPVADPWTVDDRRIADTMSSYWVNFAKTGNPNGPGLPQWPAFDPKVDQVMETGDRFQPIALADPVKVDFWRRFYATQPGA